MLLVPKNIRGFRHVIVVAFTSSQALIGNLQATDFYPSTITLRPMRTA
jgi:hypothetical protein